VGTTPQRVPRSRLRQRLTDQRARRGNPSGCASPPRREAPGRASGTPDRTSSGRPRCRGGGRHGTSRCAQERAPHLHQDHSLKKENRRVNGGFLWRYRWDLNPFTSLRATPAERPIPANTGITPTNRARLSSFEPGGDAPECTTSERPSRCLAIRQPRSHVFDPDGRPYSVRSPRLLADRPYETVATTYAGATWLVRQRTGLRASPAWLPPRASRRRCLIGSTRQRSVHG
jgi:hypothetical protein